MSTRNSRTATVPPRPDTAKTPDHDGRRADTEPTGLPHGHQPSGVEPGRRRLAPLAWVAFTLVAVVVIVVIAGVMVTSEEGATTGGNVDTVIEPTVGSQEYLNRLANQGYIPPEAVDRDLLRLERREGRGENPSASLESEGIDPRLEKLANEGLIPPEAAR